MEEDRYTRITLRIPRDLHARLQLAADKQSHSQNAEIVSRLESSFTGVPAGQVASVSVLEDYRRLADSFLSYLLTPNSHLKHSPQLKTLTEALKRATEDALEVVKSRAKP